MPSPLPGIAITSLTAPLPLLSRGALALTLTIITWQARLRTRRSLAKLEPHRLRDIGLSAEAARREIAKPFWRS